VDFLTSNLAFATLACLSEKVVFDFPVSLGDL